MTEKELMLTALLDCERVDLYVDPPRLSPEQGRKFSAMQDRRRNHEPLQYIVGECEFYGLRFKVDRRVLIPRPETEILVEKILEMMAREASFVKREAQLRILDLGTGSGNIAVTLAKFLAGAAVMAVDISRDALDLAGENARRHQVADRIRFVQADMLGFLMSSDASEGPFDIIASNPPYIKSKDMESLPPDVQQEPCVALDGGDDGLRFYRTMISRAGRFLREGGHLIAEIGDGQRDAVASLFEQSCFSSVDFILDYVKTPRILIAKK